MMLVSGLQAQPVSEQEALQKAQRFLQEKNIASSVKTVRTRSSAQGNPYKHLYLFNAENNGGFVIVAGDSRAREILAYSDQGHLDYSQMPDNMKWWLSTYDESIASIPADYTPAKTRAGASAKADVAPMMSFSWSQIAPYNKYCPQGCLAGCVPLAMAQMMVYHKYPTNLPALDAYTDANGINLPALPANYMDYNDLSGDNPALLVRYCGQAIKADYSAKATGARSGSIPSVLYRFFGYDQGVHNVYRNAYNSEAWDDVLYNELSSGRPFILSGQVNNDLNNGHTFICHGYSQGYYAVNWGWGGSQNGYFAMHALTTTSGDYSTDLAACIGIQPSAGGTANYPAFSLLAMESASGYQVTRTSSSYGFNGVNFYWRVRNSLLEKADYELGLAIIKPDGNVSLLWKYDAMSFDATFNANSTSTVNIGSEYGNGTYKITLIYKKPSDSSWQYCQGSLWRYVEAVINGNTMTFTNYPTYDAPYPTGTYPPYYPVDPVDPQDPDPQDIDWPSANASIDYPVMKTSYEEGVQIQAGVDWTTLTGLVNTKLGISATDFTKYFWADCYTDEDEEVPAEDASLVIPHAYNYNWAGDYGMNMYPMLTFNLGDDYYGNGGNVPETGDTDPDYDDDLVIVFCPKIEGATGPVISFQIPEAYADYLVEDETSPLNFTRWVRFVAKWDAQGKVAAPYRYVWLKLPLEISWNGSPDGISTVRADKADGYYYNLNGQRIDRQGAASLRKGIYIHNGKKVMIK